MTVDDFLNPNQLIRNQWVDHPDFAGLYVRKGRFIYFYEGDLRDKKHDVEDCIQISNITAMNPGSGAFTRLIAELRRYYPKHVIYVENALEDRFQYKLETMGFLRTNHPYCYVLEPT
jgi:hypothetical protein